MVNIMENPIKMDDLGGKPTIFGNIQIEILNNSIDTVDGSEILHHLGMVKTL